MVSLPTLGGTNWPSLMNFRNCSSAHCVRFRRAIGQHVLGQQLARERRRARGQRLRFGGDFAGHGARRDTCAYSIGNSGLPVARSNRKT